jgi:predicted nucleotidyltransferase component of viral defense system
MRPDAVLVRQLAADRGFADATVEKTLCLVDLLDEVARHPYLAPRLVLKGGTALNRLGPVPSVMWVAALGLRVR